MNSNYIIILISFSFNLSDGDEFATWEQNMNKYVDMVSTDFCAYINTLEDEMSRISMGAGGKDSAAGGGGGKDNGDKKEKGDDGKKEGKEGSQGQPGTTPPPPPAQGAPPATPGAPPAEDWSQVGIPVAELSDDGKTLNVLNDPDDMYAGMEGGIAEFKFE